MDAVTGRHASPLPWESWSQDLAGNRHRQQKDATAPSLSWPPAEHVWLPEKGRGGPRHNELRAVNSDFHQVTAKKEKFSLPSLLSKKKCLLPSSSHARTSL